MNNINLNLGLNEIAYNNIKSMEDSIKYSKDMIEYNKREKNKANAI